MIVLSLMFVSCFLISDRLYHQGYSCKKFCLPNVSEYCCIIYYHLYIPFEFTLSDPLFSLIFECQLHYCFSICTFTQALPINYTKSHFLYPFLPYNYENQEVFHFVQDLYNLFSCTQSFFLLIYSC